ncbi:Pyridine nucleotide-disulfide oxidoreductase [Rhizoctonia solani]|uniref:Pyridine nucleotide-disulfide oxidoreductase n=1 Tax=Rhizoctonia solani TaxID=456999 RepID=A0A8H7GY11_9AGAM|nr:Pyridine nucleotide-disulfide oxidoreductase [Rhizoctonia solani]
MYSLKNIVVVGSGGGGVPLVQTLQKQINPDTHRIVVIERRDYYAHWPALIRAAVTDEGDLHERALIFNSHAFDSTVQTIRSGVKQITDTDSSPWGAIGLAHSTFHPPLTILIVGGGSVGIEYAGEIRHYHPEKKVTLIHGGEELMNDTYVAEFRQSVLDAMISTGVEVILDDRIPPQATLIDGFMTSENGRRIPADLVVGTSLSQIFLVVADLRIAQILAAGGPLIVRAFDPSAVTESGTVLVTPELQVKISSGVRNVWAIGDIVEWPEQKMVLKASSGHAPVLAKNIIASIRGSKPSPYGGKTEMIFVTIGPNGGRGLVPLFGGVVVGDWIVSTMKSSGLFVDRTRAALGC